MGRVVVDEELRCTRDPSIYAIGDCAASIPVGGDKPVPPRAQAAYQQALTLAKSLERQQDGLPPTKPFVYKDYGSLISLGYNAVGSLMGNLFGTISIEGRLARAAYISLYRKHQLALHGPRLAGAQHAVAAHRPRHPSAAQAALSGDLAAPNSGPSGDLAAPRAGPSGDPLAPFMAARADPSLALIEGFHALKHALRFGAGILDAIANDPQELAALAAQLAPDVAAAMARIVRPAPLSTFQGHVLAIARRPFVDLPALLETQPGLLVYLERPTHLGNLGAVIRTAAAAGAAGVLTSGMHDPWHPQAIRGSAGLHFALPVARVDTLPALSRPLIAIHPEGEPLSWGAIPPGACLAFGTERAGLSPELLRRADHRAAIPMRPGVSSLNLAAAVAIVLYSHRLSRPALAE